jgi:hypothetical protein
MRQLAVDPDISDNQNIQKKILDGFCSAIG